MPEKPHNFWQELKRRKVVRVIVMYAGAAYVIIELINNVAEPLHLPEWIPTVVILMLIIGFPVVAILSWIFDITPEGIKKTESEQYFEEEEAIQIKTRRKLRISDFIIAVLFISVCILLYPKIFNTKSLDQLKDPDGRVSIAVLPFRNMTSDSLYNIWEEGTQINLIARLTGSSKLSVRQYETMNDLYKYEDRKNLAAFSPTIAGEITQKLEAKIFLLGSIFKSDQLLRLSVQLGYAGNEEIIKSFEINLSDSDEILFGIDSLANLIKNYLEIEILRLDDYNGARVLKHHITTTEAYQYYLLGLKADRNADYESALEHYSKAIELDSSFQAAKIELALCYYGLREDELWQKWLKEVLELEEGQSEAERLKLKFYRALYEKDMPGLIEIIKERLHIDKQSRNSWLNLGWASMQMNQFDQAIEAYTTAKKIVDNWGVEMKEVLFYAQLLEAYHETGQHRKERKLAKEGLKIFPDHQRIIQLQAVCKLSRGKLNEGTNLVEKYRGIRASEGIPDAEIENQTAWIYKKGGMLKEAEQYYRKALKMQPDNPSHILSLSEFLTEYKVNVKEGLELANMAQKKHPEDYRFYYPLGVGQFYLGNYQEAFNLLKEYDYHTPYYDHDLMNYLELIEKALANPDQD